MTFSDIFVPGRPGTEEFVPGFFLLLLSCDKGTAGQGFFCPRAKERQDKESFFVRDKGTTGLPVPDCPGISHPMETLLSILCILPYCLLVD